MLELRGRGQLEVKITNSAIFEPIVKSGSFMIIIKELRDPAVNLLHQRPVEKG